MGQFVIRADASIEMGTGHVMRCLTLASVLVGKGHNCHFICRDHPGNLANIIRDQGFDVTVLEQPSIFNEIGDDNALAHAAWLGCSQEQDAQQVTGVLKGLGFNTIDCLIVDHYALDITWESLLRIRVGRLMVIDDLFDRKHDCDILVNQNLGVSTHQYKHLVPSHCRILAGIQYAMLRPEFQRFRRLSLDNKSHSRPKQLLITMGGVDPDNYTGRILEKLKNCDCETLSKVVIILGETAPHKDAVVNLASSMSPNIEIKIGVRNMAEIMANSDIAFGAAGSTSWERCCLGLPTLLFVIADNQSDLAEVLEQHKAIIRADINADAQKLCTSFQRLLVDVDHYRATSRAAALICDGRGVDRVMHICAENIRTL